MFEKGNHARRNRAEELLKARGGGRVVPDVDLREAEAFLEEFLQNCLKKTREVSPAKDAATVLREGLDYALSHVGPYHPLTAGFVTEITHP